MGRPRKYANDDAAERTRASRAALAASGGRLLSLRLSADEAAALAALRVRDGHPTDRDAIAAALLSAVSRPPH